MSGSMFVAGGFRAIECVLNHGPPQQGCGQRMLSFDQLRRRIQQVVEITVDLRGTRQHQSGGAGLVRPTSEKVERRRETPELKGMSHDLRAHLAMSWSAWQPYS